jgi:hypothetical protein
LVCLKFGEIGGIVDPHRDAIEADAIDATDLFCWRFAPKIEIEDSERILGGYE